MDGEIWDGINEFENKYGFKSPPLTYALFESAIRASSGKSMEDHIHFLGRLFEKFLKIASLNPFSWTNKTITAEELIEVSIDNRMVAYPYTKRLCANLFVDQSASIIITGEKTAIELEIDPKFWVYVMGGSDLKNIHEVTRRPQLHNSPAAFEASKLALKQAGLTIKDITAFDLYSCFPSIVEILMNEIGITEGDPRDLTITGGLPYFGGPWSNYSLHSIVNAYNMICDNQTHKIMIVANGGYNSKQSIGIYGKEPPEIPWSGRDDTEIQEKILKDILEKPIEKANGMIRVDAFTMTYERNGDPKEGIIVGSFENGHRTLALLKGNPKILKNFERVELVGKKLVVNYNSDIDRNVVILNEM
jgi:acetyl-CoA C-acetyltransferase